MKNSIQFSDFEMFLTEQSEGNDIAATVAREALQSEMPKAFLQDLMNHGCICGMV